MRVGGCGGGDTPPPAQGEERDNDGTHGPHGPHGPTVGDHTSGPQPTPLVANASGGGNAFQIHSSASRCTKMFFTICAILLLAGIVLCALAARTGEDASTKSDISHGNMLNAGGGGCFMLMCILFLLYWYWNVTSSNSEGGNEGMSEGASVQAVLMSTDL